MKEALVFMLVSFRGHWKYSVGYILDNTVNTEDLHCLLSRLLDLCAMDEIKVKCITCDGNMFNFGTIKLFCCKLGKNIYEIFIHALTSCILHLIHLNAQICLECTGVACRLCRL